MCFSEKKKGRYFCVTLNSGEVQVLRTWVGHEKGIKRPCAGARDGKVASCQRLTAEVGAQQLAQQTVGSAVQCPPAVGEDGGWDSDDEPMRHHVEEMEQDGGCWGADDASARRWLPAGARAATGDAAGGASRNEGVTRGSEGSASGATVVNSKEGLNVHAQALQAGLACGHGWRALRRLLLQEHRVSASIDLLKHWIAVERAKQAGAQVINS